ncbi:hypothetical protein [Paenibacillus sp. BC26]|uniref:hypothetical protein n=1 Tax=Paenibacillus sp. BC26 TaxID=1881032 RepID=UPI0008E00D61|nr:hypothetical protein [Paenibacillus sp. BC26]SFT25234.1 hypothetical protein SAMN05428962_5787 [Paenibacillus sp. BC26]
MSIFGFVFILILVFIVIKLFQSRGTQQQRSSGFNTRNGGRRSSTAPPMRKPPEYLGVPEGHPARSAAERLEAALSPDFEARVKDRVLKRTPSMREGEWQWQWFELKRYFLMCGVLRNVPMYSVRVDEVWHEMLMFTREYEQFCKQFCGGTIHHAPHGSDAKPAPGERAWFDWIYGELFLPVPVSGQLWGAFYRTPLPRELMYELETGDPSELRSKRFNEKAAAQFGDLDATIDYLIERGSKLASSKDEPVHNRVADSSDMMSTGVLSGMFFYSSFGPSDNFHNQMDEHQTQEQRDANGDGAGSDPICSGADQDSSDFNDGGDFGDSGNGGGSSCSGGGDSGGGGESGGGSSCGSSCGGSS